MENIQLIVPTTTFPRTKGDYWANFLLTLFKEVKKKGEIDIKIIAPHFYKGKIKEVIGGINIERYQYFMPSKFEKIAYGDGIAVNLKKNPLLNLQLPFFLFTYFCKLIKEYKNSDIIHAQLAPSGLLSIYVRKLFREKKPIITSFYGRDVPQCKKYKKIYKKLFEEGNLFLVLSKEMKKEVENLGCNPDKIVILLLGINIDEFLVKREFDKDVIEFLFVGRIIEKKGLTWGIKAFNECFKKNKNIRLTVLGNGLLLNKIKKQVEDLNLSNAVSFVDNSKANDPRKVTKEYFKKADIFLLPSVEASDGDKEGTPVVLMEAQAAGLPCITTDHAGIPEMIINEKTGFISEEKDFIAMSKNMLKLIENRDLLKQMSYNAKKFANKNYDLKKQSKKLFNFYKGELKNERI